LACIAPSQDVGAQEKKTYWDKSWSSSNCNSERQQMMQTALERADSWCRSRGGVDRRRTDLRFIVDKGMKTGSKTKYCELKGTIVCN
jgi:hypothetical protein